MWKNTLSHNVKGSRKNPIPIHICTNLRWPGLQIGPQILIWMSIRGMCWNKSDPWSHPPTHRTQRIYNKSLRSRYHRTPPEVLWQFLDNSELFWLHNGSLHNTNKVVLMLWLIYVYCCPDIRLSMDLDFGRHYMVIWQKCWLFLVWKAAVKWFHFQNLPDWSNTFLYQLSHCNSHY